MTCINGFGGVHLSPQSLDAGLFFSGKSNIRASPCKANTFVKLNDTRMKKVITKIIVLLATGLVFYSCQNDDPLFEGTLTIYGTVADDYTGKGIPNVKLTFTGVSGDVGIFGGSVELGSFKTNSSGQFWGELRKLRDVERYDIMLIEESQYYSTVLPFSVVEMETQSDNLNLEMSRYTDLEIRLEKIADPNIPDTLYLSWGVIQNSVYGPFDPIIFDGTQPDIGHRWIGGEVRTTIRTRTLANKHTEIIVDLYRNGTRTLTFDTLYCERNVLNTFDIFY